jgi:hypothetical protein
MGKFTEKTLTLFTDFLGGIKKTTIKRQTKDSFIKKIKLKFYITVFMNHKIHKLPIPPQEKSLRG